MNQNLDQQSCAICRMCYRRNTPQCNDACRRCSVALFSADTVNVYPYNNSNVYPTYGSHDWPYTPNYPYGYPKHSPNMKSQGRLYYNYPRVTNQYNPSMLPFGNYYGSLYRPSISYS